MSASPPAADREETVITPPPTEPEVLNDEPASKKRKSNVLEDTTTKKRNARMFGALMGTLNKFKAEGSKSTAASKRRTDIEERLASKLKQENEELQKKSARQKEERSLKSQVQRKIDEKSMVESIHKTRQASALSLANFLCTGHPTTAQPSTSIAGAYDHGLPLYSVDPSPIPRLYFLPYKLLPSQSTVLADQAAAASKWVDKDRATASDLLKGLQTEIDDLKEKRDRGLEELERLERAERAERERLERDKEDGSPPPSSSAVRDDQNGTHDDDGTTAMEE